MLADLQAVSKPTNLQILVSLSYTMFTTAQRMATEDPSITAQAYDVNHFSALREKCKVMSVPCLVVNGGEKVSFGMKNVWQLLNLLP